MVRKKCRIFILFRFGHGYIEYNHIREMEWWKRSEISHFHGLIEHDYIWKAEQWKWGTKASYDQGMGNRGEVFMTWEGFEPGTWSLELWDPK